jgi:hypothetical protein
MLVSNYLIVRPTISERFQGSCQTNGSTLVFKVVGWDMGSKNPLRQEKNSQCKSSNCVSCMETNLDNLPDAQIQQDTQILEIKGWRTELLDVNQWRKC